MSKCYQITTYDILTTVIIMSVTLLTFLFDFQTRTVEGEKIIETVIRMFYVLIQFF